MGACCVQKGILFLELGRTERGRFHISSAPHQGLFGSEPRPPLRLGLGSAVWSAQEFDGLYSHQPKRSAPVIFFGLVRTKQGRCEYALRHIYQLNSNWFQMGLVECWRILVYLCVHIS